MAREVRYCTTEDGVRIAYCVEGEGPTTILALPAFYESFSLDHLMPVYQQFYRELGAGHKMATVLESRVATKGRAIAENFRDSTVAVGSLVRYPPR